MQHGRTFSYGKITWEISNSIRRFLEFRFKLFCEGKNWPEIIAILENYRPSYSFNIVSWIPRVVH